MKIISWNINGIRSGWSEFANLIKSELPDIVCLQEIKIAPKDLTQEMKDFQGYHSYFYHADKPGYSGVAIFSKIKPKKVNFGINVEEFDREGRTISASFEKFDLVNCYFPHSGRELARLPYKHSYNDALSNYVKKNDLERVIVCGDLNVAHSEIDLARPKDNQKNAGFTQSERKWMDDFLSSGLIDVYRNLYPEKIEYTWWANFFQARARNIGWRIDYFLTSKEIFSHVDDCRMLTGQMGSDHCPIVLQMKDE
jgi:exodeoxyribonuclease-3